MEERFVAVEQRDDGVAVVRLDRPKMNALSMALLRQLGDAAAALAADPPGAVVVWGGERIFAAGADISEFAGPDEARAVGAAFRGALDALESIPRATIAAIAGYALGGGCELTLGCDFRIAADTAKFGQPEILLGIIPGGGGTQRLPRLIGPARAKEIIFSGRQVPADEALRIGLVDRVVPADQLFDEAVSMGGRTCPWRRPWPRVWPSAPSIAASTDPWPRGSTSSSRPSPTSSTRRTRRSASSRSESTALVKPASRGNSLLLVVVAGWPAAGKTTLAREFGVRLGLPVFTKDDVKELLFDTLGVGDRAWSKRLGHASIKVLEYQLETVLAAGQSVVGECNWDAT